MFCQDLSNSLDRPGAGLQGKFSFNCRVCCIIAKITPALFRLLTVSVTQIRSIIHTIWHINAKMPMYLTYSQPFDIVPQSPSRQLDPGDVARACVPDPVTSMYV